MTLCYMKKLTNGHWSCWKCVPWGCLLVMGEKDCGGKRGRKWARR